VEAERLFLTLTIAHYEGGVQMAEAFAGRSTNRAVLDFAHSILKAQSMDHPDQETLVARD
jgi:uncharacterized protein (DUF305 family)